MRFTVYGPGGTRPLDRAGPAAGVVAEISVSQVDRPSETRGVLGECFVRWYSLAGEQWPRVEVFADSWGLLPDLSRLLTGLASATPPAPAGVARVMRAAGWEEMP
jgi:hypothetical protein